MAVKYMYDYLDLVVPDSNALLDIDCQVELIETGYYPQVIHTADDESEQVVTFTTTPIFIVELQWPVESEANTGTILDFYMNSSYGFGQARSFKWLHPTDGYKYVVKFRGQISRRIRPGRIYGIQTVQLKVLGGLSPAILTIAEPVHDQLTENIDSVFSFVLGIDNPIHDQLSSIIALSS